MRGIPFSVREGEIAEFFQGLKIQRDGIHIVRTPDGRLTGEAYVEFTSHEDIVAAQRKNKERIGSRYIELFTSTVDVSARRKKKFFFVCFSVGTRRAKCFSPLLLFICCACVGSFFFFKKKKKTHAGGGGGGFGRFSGSVSVRYCDGQEMENGLRRAASGGQYGMGRYDGGGAETSSVSSSF